MPTLGFDHYNLRAPRALLDELCRFYCEVLGLTLGWRPPFSSFGYWLYAGERAILHLSVAAPGEERQAGAVNTFDHVAFSCSDRAGFERDLAARAIHFKTAHVPQTGQVQLFFRDPAGNGIELNFAEAP
jgi:catechol 2,3-dioxygenase-like lactoylglutathione lyase family enzyme